MSGSSSAPARKPRRWLLVIAAAALLVGILPVLLLAQWGPYALERALSAYLHTSVTVQRVTGGWWNGVTVHQLAVAEDPTAPAPTLVRVGRLTINLPVLALLFSSKPLALHLDEVRIQLRRRQDGQWNLSPFLKAFGTSASPRSHARALIPRLDRQVAVTVTQGALRLGEGVELTDLAIGLHVAAGRLTVSRAEASIAGGVIAVQGEVSLQQPTVDKALQWRLAGVHLARLLGPAFQSVTMAEATGRLTQQGDGFLLETSAQAPTFALAPGTLGRRQPHLTGVAVSCTLALSPPFTRLATEACRLHAAEAHLSLRGSTLELGHEPRLTLQVDGSLAGRLVGALAPEVPGEFPGPVHVDGRVTVPLRDAVWQAMGWRLAVTAERFVFDDTYTEVHTTVVKSVGRLEIADLRARRGTGRIHGAGAWRLDGPVDGGLQVELDRVALRQSLAQDAAESPYLVEGSLSGSIAWRTDDDGEHVTVDGHVHPLQLRRATATLVRVPEGRIQGRLGRDRDGTWWADSLTFLSDDLRVTLHQGRVRRSPLETARFELDATVGVEGAWLTPLLATAGVGGLVLSGRSEVTLQAAGGPDHPFETMQGKGSVHAAHGSFHNQAFSGVDVTYELRPGRLHIPQGVVTFEAGTAVVRGSLGFLRPFNARDDEISLHLHQMPLRLTDQEPATPSMITVLNGEVTARGTGGGEVRLQIDLQVPKTPLQVWQSGQVPTGVELPALHVTSEVLTAAPWVHWEASAIRVQGDGLAAELRDVVARRTPTGYDLSGGLEL
jgi:hypothetical protein